MFSWDKLRKYLIEDEADPNSSNDFGHDILPKMLNCGERMMAFEFNGYWKDVGTIDSLWESNMDLLNPKVEMKLNDESWRIYSRNPIRPPHYIAEKASVQAALITEGCSIYGNVDSSVIFSNVIIENGATVSDSIIMPGAVIKSGATVQYAIIGEDAVIGEGAVIGKRPEEVEDLDNWGVAVIGQDCIIKPGVTIAPKEMIDAETNNKEAE